MMLLISQHLKKQKRELGLFKDLIFAVNFMSIEITFLI